MHTLFNTKENERGYVMLFSILITAIILSIIIGIANVSFRQRQFTQQVTQSTRAFYAAETALECLTALDNRGDFGDLSNPLVGLPSVIVQCDGAIQNFESNSILTATGWVYEYDFTNGGLGVEVSPDPSVPMCARAKITKYDVVDMDVDGVQDTSPAPANTPFWLHTIEVWGYNVSCTDLNQYYIDIAGSSISPIAKKLVERSFSYKYITEE